MLVAVIVIRINYQFGGNTPRHKTIENYNINPTSSLVGIYSIHLPLYEGRLTSMYFMP